MSEETDAMAGEISQSASLLSTLHSFTEHAGWKVFNEMLDEQKNSRLGQFAFKPLNSMDEVLAQEFMKGEMSGLSLAQVALFAYMETLKSSIELANAKLEKENEQERIRTDDAGRVGRVDGDAFGE